MNKKKTAGRKRPPISLWGVGDWGVRTLDRLLPVPAGKVEKVAVDSDLQSLVLSSAGTKIQLAGKSLSGLGTGGDREKGARAFEEKLDAIRRRLEKSGMIVVVAGLGGGLGSAAAPGLCRLAVRLGLPLLALFTIPFDFEGKKRAANCREAVGDLSSEGIPYLGFSLDRMLGKIEESAPCGEAFQFCDRLLDASLSAVISYLTSPPPLGGDLACLRNLFSPGRESLAVSARCDHPEKTVASVKGALTQLALNAAELKSASGALLCVQTGKPLPVAVLRPALGTLSQYLADGSELLFTVREDDSLENRIELILVITGLAARDRRPSTAAPLIFDASALPPKQGELALGKKFRGAFSDVDPTMVDGEDLDIPTFIREGFNIG